MDLDRYFTVDNHPDKGIFSKFRLGGGNLYNKDLLGFFLFFKVYFRLAPFKLWRYFIYTGRSLDHMETMAVFGQIIQEKAYK